MAILARLAKAKNRKTSVQIRCTSRTNKTSVFDSDPERDHNQRGKNGNALLATLPRVSRSMPAARTN
jgi:hypothetical protein